MNFKDLIILLLLIYLINQNFKNKKYIEKMTDVRKEEIDNLIKKNIKIILDEVYQADIESIRNLERIATTLQKDGLTIPGNLTVSGKLTVNKDTNIDGNLKLGKKSEGHIELSVNEKDENNKKCLLKIKSPNGNYLQLGANNRSWVRIESNKQIYFPKSIQTSGTVYSYYNKPYTLKSDHDKLNQDFNNYKNSMASEVKTNKLTLSNNHKLTSHGAGLYINRADSRGITLHTSNHSSVGLLTTKGKRKWVYN